MTSTVSDTDIVQLVEQDHWAAEELLDQFEHIALEGRDDYFWEVVRELVAHEVAEEVVVYPAIRADAPNGEAEADLRIDEESEAEKQLVALEHLDRQSPEFDQAFKELRAAVLKHARSEEAHILPLLVATETEDERGLLGQRYEQAKSSAPSHPHPHAPATPPGNTVTGPVTAMFDRVRDTLHGR